MKFSHALIVFVAGTSYALPQGQGQWSDWQQPSSVPAPNKADSIPASGEPVDDQQASPTLVTSPTAGLDAGQGQWSGWQKSSPTPLASPVPTSTGGGQDNGKPGDQQASPLSVASPIPSPPPSDQQASPSPIASPVPSPPPSDQQASPTLAASPIPPPVAGATQTGNLDVQPAQPTPVASSAPSQGIQQGQWSDWQQTSTAPLAAPMTSPAAGPNVPRNLAVSGTPPLPSPNVAFKAPAADISSMLGAGPSPTCTWEFVLTCASQASTAGSTCMVPMAESSTNCFSQPACAAAIGENAEACASCFTSAGKQQFIRACYEEQSNSNVAPIFEAMVSYGVCDAQGAEINA